MRTGGLGAVAGGVARRTLVVVAAALCVLAGAGAPASAHNALTGSDPEDGATVASAPEQVELRFLASLDPDRAELDVTGPDGESVMAGDPVFDGAQVTIPLTARFAGDYRIAYGVVSNDGHFVDGTIEFTLTEGEPLAAPSPSPSPAVAAPAPATDPPAPADTASPIPVGTEASSGPNPTGWLVGAVVLALLVGAGYGGWRWRRRSA